MYLSLRHLRTVRRVAGVAFALFYVLAASRVLVPNLCLTQREAGRAAEAAAACCVKAIAPCCAKTAPNPDAPPANPGSGESPHCAFCHLAKAFSEPLPHYQYPLILECADAPYLRNAGGYHSREIAEVSQGRAPPLPA